MTAAASSTTTRAPATARYAVHRARAVRAVCAAGTRPAPGDRLGCRPSTIWSYNRVGTPAPFACVRVRRISLFAMSLRPVLESPSGRPPLGVRVPPEGIRALARFEKALRLRLARGRLCDRLSAVDQPLMRRRQDARRRMSAVRTTPPSSTDPGEVAADRVGDRAATDVGASAASRPPARRASPAGACDAPSTIARTSARRLVDRGRAPRRSPADRARRRDGPPTQHAARVRRMTTGLVPGRAAARSRPGRRAAASARATRSIDADRRTRAPRRRRRPCGRWPRGRSASRRRAAARAASNASVAGSARCTSSTSTRRGSMRSRTPASRPNIAGDHVVDHGHPLGPAGTRRGAEQSAGRRAGAGSRSPGLQPTSMTVALVAGERAPTCASSRVRPVPAGRLDEHDRRCRPGSPHRAAIASTTRSRPTNPNSPGGSTSVVVTLGDRSARCAAPTRSRSRGASSRRRCRGARRSSARRRSSSSSSLRRPMRLTEREQGVDLGAVGLVERARRQAPRALGRGSTAAAASPRARASSATASHARSHGRAVAVRAPPRPMR